MKMTNSKIATTLGHDTYVTTGKCLCDEYEVKWQGIFQYVVFMYL